jgi:hypothetical protein
LPELARLADCVVEGVVSDVGSTWNSARTQIHTHVRFAETTSLAGACPSGALDVRVTGGTAGGIVMSVPGSPHFTRGEHVVLFLRATRERALEVLGLYQGKLAVTTDSSGRERIGNKTVGWFSREALVATIAHAREGR